MLSGIVDIKAQQEQQTTLLQDEVTEISVLNSKLYFLKLGKYYCLLSSVYSNLINSNDKNVELNRAHLEKAKQYQKSAEKILPPNNPDLYQASCDLVVAYFKHAVKTKVDTKLSVLFLQTALNLQHKYGLNTTITQIHLGISYHNRAEEFLSHSDPASAMQDYENAIIMTPTVEKNDSHIKDKLEQLCILGLSHERLGERMRDVSHSKKANYYFDLYLAHSDKSDRYYPLISKAMKDRLGSASKCRV